MAANKRIGPLAALMQGASGASLVPVYIWEAVLQQANERVTIQIDGQRRTRVSRLEASLIELGSDNPQNHRAVREFVLLTRTAADELERVNALKESHARNRRDLRSLARSVSMRDNAKWRAALLRWAKRNSHIERMADEDLASNLKKAQLGKFG